MHSFKVIAILFALFAFTSLGCRRSSGWSPPGSAMNDEAQLNCERNTALMWASRASSRVATAP